MFYHQIICIIRNSNSLTPSTTLSAIGMDEQDIHSCIRMTFGEESQEELDYVCETLKQCVKSLRNFNKDPNEEMPNMFSVPPISDCSCDP